jgi:tetratricopeptide (TPR) repeat protein
MTTSRLQQIEEMLKNEPGDSFLNYALALEFAKNNNLLKAVDLIEKIVIRNENYLGAYYQLGQYYEQLKATEKAIDTYKKGIEIAQQQNNRKTWGELNEALLNLEDN